MVVDNVEDLAGLRCVENARHQDNRGLVLMADPKVKIILSVVSFLVAAVCAIIVFSRGC